MNDEIPVRIEALVPTPQGVGVFLGVGEQDKVIALFVDPVVAAALTMSIREIKTPRPLTHDLLVNVLTGLGVRVRKVVINDLKNETFFARLHLLQENELGRSLVEVDARPSDAMVIAVRTDCPIRVARSVWDRADDMRWALEQARETMDPGGDAPPGPAGEPEEGEGHS